MNRTHGGIPESEALHWDPETYQRLGRIVFNLVSGKPESRYNGYNDYHEMHRHFMASEWDELLRELDFFRVAHKAPRLVDLLQKVRDEIVELKYPIPAVEVSAIIPPYEVALKELDNTMKRTKPLITEDVEQMSLFG